MYKVNFDGELIPNRIFVGGLPETSDDELREYFSRICGPNHIVDLKYMENFKASAKGICFVTFDSENEVTKFLNLNSELVFKNTKLKISNAYRRYNHTKSYANQNYNQQSANYSHQVDINYYSNSNVEDTELCVMTPTPPIAATEPTNTDNLNEIASSSSASSASSHSQHSELTEEVKHKSQAVSSSSTSSVTALNSELTTLTTINPSTEKDSSSMLFSSSSSSSSTSSKSTSISNLNKSSDIKLESQAIDSNNNKNLDQRPYKRHQQNDSFRSNMGQNRSQNFQQRNNNFNQRSNRFNNSFSSQNEPLTVQTSSSRTQQQQMTSPYYHNHSNPISPVKMKPINQKQHMQTQQQKTYKNSDMLKINTNTNASSYVGSVISAVYPETKMNQPPVSSGSKVSYPQNSQSHNNVSAAAETIANYANQTASVNSASMLNQPAQSLQRPNANSSNQNVYPSEVYAHQMKQGQAQGQAQAHAQYVYPNFYYYTNPSALPMAQNSIYIDPSVQRSAQMPGPLTPHSYNAYFQGQANQVNSTENQIAQSQASSQSTITNAFETANGNQNASMSSSLSVDQLDEMMQKNLNINQYDAQQYQSQPVYYVAHVPNSQYYAYYYTPSAAVLGQNQGQGQVQIIAPVPTPSSTPASTSSQMNQSFQSQPSYSQQQHQQQQQQQQHQQQIMPHLYMQQQMMSGSVVNPNATQPVPILQLPTISYYNSSQQTVIPQMLTQGQQYQYQQLTQASPQQQQNTYPGNTQMYQYISGITPLNQNVMQQQNSAQNRSIQRNQKQSSQVTNKPSYSSRQQNEQQPMISPAVKLEAKN